MIIRFSHWFSVHGPYHAQSISNLNTTLLNRGDGFPGCPWKVFLKWLTKCRDMKKKWNSLSLNQTWKFSVKSPFDLKLATSTFTNGIVQHDAKIGVLTVTGLKTWLYYNKMPPPICFTLHFFSNRWRQNATVKFNYGEAKCKRYYFKLKIGPGNDYTNEFSKHAIECSLHEKQLLIWYQGDNSVVVDFSHGNAKDPEKEYHRTAPSVLSKLRNVKKKLPSQVYSELVLAIPEQSERHVTDAPRNIQQIRNAHSSARKAERLSMDAICTLNELRSETYFVNDIHLAPSLLVICFKSSML